MSSPPKAGSSASSAPNGDANPPTVAAFSPSTSIHSPSLTKQRSAILVHQKSPLLVATPPQITRALAYSHPFIAPLNKFVGLLSWTTGDPWESFLMVAAFWAVTLYGDTIIRWAGPILGVIALILGMYARRYSPLSSTSWTGEKGAKSHKRSDSELLRHHKSLDEIVDTLKMFTSRCNILLDPFLRLTDFLSTQRTATSATTRPALTTLFIRILLVTPIWVLLTLPPFCIITTRRVVLATGTVTLTWHSRPARVCRIIIWRSRLIRRICTTITGLQFAESPQDGNGKPPPPARKKKTPHEVAASLGAKRRPESPGIRFTFTLYENQRRWLGIGWTSSMLAYERAAWTDEHLNPAPSKDKFELPEVEGGHARWRWVEGSEWHIDTGEDEALVGLKSHSDNGNDEETWIYYDNKWKDGRRGKDGWGRYTRRRKWCRDAELVEITPSTEITPSPTPKPGGSNDDAASIAESTSLNETGIFTSGSSQKKEDPDSGSSTTSKRKSWFRRLSQPASEKSMPLSTSSTRSKEEEDDDHHTPYRQREDQSAWGFGEDAQMGLS